MIEHVRSDSDCAITAAKFASMEMRFAAWAKRGGAVERSDADDEKRKRRRCERRRLLNLKNMLSQK
jgi:hypothetical protein